MKFKEQVVFDISADKFRYLHRAENKIKPIVDIVELNKRLNRNKKLNFYSNTKIIALSLLCLAFSALISLKF